MDNLPRPTTRWKNARALLVALVLAGATAEAAYLWKSPAVFLLPPRPEGSWIRRNYQRNLYIHKDPDTVGFFRKDFTAPAPANDIVVAVTAFRNAIVYLDGKPLRLSDVSSWKDPIRFTVPGRLLPPGTHELGVFIANRMGPPIFHISSSLQELQEIRGWESSGDGIEWRPALRGDEKLNTDLRGMFPTVSYGLSRSLPLVLTIFLGTLLLAVSRPGFCLRLVSPVMVRGLLWILLLALGVNNAFKLPPQLGFDAIDHLDYVMYLYERHGLPLASEGLQMFQPPLYYVLSASLYWVLDKFFPFPTALLLLKAIPVGCALLLVDISYRLLRELFPDREDLQSCGLFIGGLLPMNLYMCQYYGNEPLAAVMTALLLLLSVKMHRRSGAIPIKDALLIGVVAGLALLAKATPFILILMVGALILAVPGGRQCGIETRLKTMAIFLLTASVVAGWYYVRNWLVFGKPFIGGWDSSRGITWWQDPGYRVLSDFYAFGEVFLQPVYAAFNGFGDALYSTFWSDGYLSASVEYRSRPKWNYVPLAAGVGLSIVPASAMAAGIVIALWRSGKEELWPFAFLAISIGAYLVALVHLYALLPIYSTAKASYTMGLTPAYAVMVALGVERIFGIEYARRIFVSFLVTWGITTYVGFFVV